MVRTKKTPRERLAEEVTYLPEEDWKKVRRYVTMLRRLRRMDYKAFAELVDAGVAEWKDQDKTLHGNDVYCDFCGKSQWEVKRMLAGKGGYICDECIELCCEVLKEEFENEQKEEQKK